MARGTPALYMRARPNSKANRFGAKQAAPPSRTGDLRSGWHEGALTRRRLSSELVLPDQAARVCVSTVGVDPVALHPQGHPQSHPQRPARQRANSQFQPALFPPRLEILVQRDGRHATSAASRRGMKTKMPESITRISSIAARILHDRGEAEGTCSITARKHSIAARWRE